MDKTKWPKIWKEQYNSVIRRRRAIALVKAKRESLIEEIKFPQIWKLEASEEAVFSFIGYNFPLEKTLAKLLQNYFSPDAKESLRLSESYLFYTDKIFPGYYSDRERMVVLLNRFKDTKQFDKLTSWMGFFSDGEDHKYNNLLLGILCLNEFLTHLEDEWWLSKAINHLFLAIHSTKEEKPAMALKGVLAFAHYMNRDFNKSLGILAPVREDSFEGEFQELIKKIA